MVCRIDPRIIVKLEIYQYYKITHEIFLVQYIIQCYNVACRMSCKIVNFMNGILLLHVILRIVYVSGAMEDHITYIAIFATIKIPAVPAEGKQNIYIQ